MPMPSSTYRNTLLRNVTTGKTGPLRKYPKTIESIFTQASLRPPRSGRKTQRERGLAVADQLVRAPAKPGDLIQ